MVTATMETLRHCAARKKMHDICVNSTEQEEEVGPLSLSLIISLIISQIRSKYFNSVLINCAPQGVWRPAGLSNQR